MIFCFVNFSIIKKSLKNVNSKIYHGAKFKTEDQKEAWRGRGHHSGCRRGRLLLPLPACARPAQGKHGGPLTLRKQSRASPRLPSPPAVSPRGGGRPTCPAVVGVRVQVVEALQVLRVDDGGPRRPPHQLPQRPGRAGRSRPDFFSDERGMGRGQSLRRRTHINYAEDNKTKYFSKKSPRLRRLVFAFKPFPLTRN